MFDGIIVVLIMSGENNIEAGVCGYFFEYLWIFLEPPLNDISKIE